MTIRIFYRVIQYSQVIQMIQKIAEIKYAHGEIVAGYDQKKKTITSIDLFDQFGHKIVLMPPAIQFHVINIEFSCHFVNLAV